MYGKKHVKKYLHIYPLIDDVEKCIKNVVIGNSLIFKKF